MEKLRIALLRQISRYGWRLIMTALEAACEHGAMHQQTNPQAVALWRWRAHGCENCVIGLTRPGSRGGRGDLLSHLEAALQEFHGPAGNLYALTAVFAPQLAAAP